MDPKYEMFGVSRHQYRLNAPVDRAFVREMEEKYHFMLLAYKYNWVIIVITVILCVIYYSIFIITYISLGNSMNNAVYNKLKHSENLSEKQIEFLKAIPTSSVHINDICVFALSVLFPGIAAIVQIVLPLG